MGETEKRGNDDVISFFPRGCGFRIHKQQRFIAEILPKYFSTSRLSSFQRQLLFYGFHRISKGVEKGGYSHKYFVKGQKYLCKHIKRNVFHDTKKPSHENERYSQNSVDDTPPQNHYQYEQMHQDPLCDSP